MAFVECNLCCDNIGNGCALLLQVLLLLNELLQLCTSFGLLIAASLTTNATPELDRISRVSWQLGIFQFYSGFYFLGFSSKVVTVLATALGHQRPTRQSSPFTAVTLRRLQQIL